MVILHIAYVKNELFSGVAVAVPQHVRAQGEFARVGFVNVTGDVIPGIENQFPYEEKFSLSALPEPFCKPDLIVFHEVYRPAYLKLYREAKAAKIPYIIIPHGCLTIGAQKKKALKKLVGNILLFNRFVRNADAVQYLSKDELQASPFGRRKFIGTNGIPMPAEQKSIFGRGIVQLTYIGRLDAYHKGLDLMAEAIRAASLDLQAERCKFDIYGPDLFGWLEELRAIVKKNCVEDFVTLHGPICGEEKKQTLLNSDLFIQTSRFEGMPMGILEALSYGLPCLVTRGTQLGEIIERYDAGWVAETDAASIAETILKALNERDCWEEKSRNAVRLIKENFRWETVAQATVEEYQRMVKKN